MLRAPEMTKTPAVGAARGQIVRPNPFTSRGDTKIMTDATDKRITQICQEPACPDFGKQVTPMDNTIDHTIEYEFVDLMRCTGEVTTDWGLYARTVLAFDTLAELDEFIADVSAARTRMVELNVAIGA